VQCRVGATAAQPPPPTPTAQTPTAAPPAPSPGKPAPVPTASAAPAGLNQFSTEADAKGHCPPDTVVWVNLRSKIYHYAGHKTYGNTKDGAYMCERDTTAGDVIAAPSEEAEVLLAARGGANPDYFGHGSISWGRDIRARRRDDASEPLNWSAEYASGPQQNPLGAFLPH
jgi:hypothetical protein